jgi:hypothetical protein
LIIFEHVDTRQTGREWDHLPQRSGAFQLQTPEGWSAVC